MKRGFVLVEGQTEETFVRDLLNEHLGKAGLFLTPIVLSTKRTKSGAKYRGGLVGFSQLRSELVRLLNDSSAAVITTMIDLYGIPGDFPCGVNAPRRTYLERALDLEMAFGKAIDHPRFLPYLSVHEFEALLFTDVRALAQALESPAIEPALGATARDFASPEEIDDGPDTHPAARILTVARGYRKPFHRPLVARRIGLDALRVRCPHFGEWLTKLEAVASR